MVYDFVPIQNDVLLTIFTSQIFREFLTFAKSLYSIKFLSQAKARMHHFLGKLNALQLLFQIFFQICHRMKICSKNRFQLVCSLFSLRITPRIRCSTTFVP